VINTGEIAFDVAFKAVKYRVVLMGLVIGPGDLEHAKVSTLTPAAGEGVVNENIFKDGFNDGDDGVMEDAVNESGG